jgi:hypothetical protein
MYETILKCLKLINKQKTSNTSNFQLLMNLNSTLNFSCVDIFDVESSIYSLFENHETFFLTITDSEEQIFSIQNLSIHPILT